MKRKYGENENHLNKIIQFFKVDAEIIAESELRAQLEIALCL